MNVKKLMQSVLTVMVLMVSVSAAASTGTVDFTREIAKQVSAVDSAKKAGQISQSEQKALKSELDAIKALYKKYSQDKLITPTEAQALKVKLKKSDLNLFRKKYD
ncbi:hypothetical protein EOL70_11960 [Leucothrix sargassi]|nr:hypothetical protein EOL70_11960 [Leucothrix sargassi]